MTATRAPRRTEREKAEDWFFDLPYDRQERQLEAFWSLHRQKERQSAQGLLKEAEPIAEHDAGGENFEGATQ